MGETQKTNFNEKEPSQRRNIRTVQSHGLRSTMNKKDGSIDHRGHTGNDRTPSQKDGDKRSAETRKRK